MQYSFLSFNLKVISSSICLLLAGYSSALEKPLNLDLNTVTVSGLSSGAYMANQFHIAHSDWVSGAGLIASGPYYCAQNSLTRALSHCVGKPKEPPSLSETKALISQWAEEGLIAPLVNLRNDKVWILGGTHDTTVGSELVELLAEQYHWLIDKSQASTDTAKPFGHVFPTENYGTECQLSESPYIGNCNFDAAGKILNHLYQGLKTPAIPKPGNLLEISQSTHIDHSAIGLGETGFIYVPTTCQSGEPCKLHISFHGCNQNSDAIGKTYVENAGFNRWAESNSLVVLYPQTKNTMAEPFNPQGCWDWWGYTDAQYATKNGKQIKAIVELIKAISGEQNER